MRIQTNQQPKSNTRRVLTLLAAVSIGLVAPWSSSVIAREVRGGPNPKHVTKSWSKGELKGSLAVRPVEQKMMKVIGIFSGSLEELAKRQKVDNKDGIFKFHTANKEMKKEIWLYKLSTLEVPEDRTNADTGGFAKYLQIQSTDILNQRMSATLPIIDQFKSGLNFDVGYSAKNSNPKTKKPEFQKYGLKLKEIRPPAKADGLVSINTSMEGDLPYAAKADLVWTIGPIDESEKNRKIFTIPVAVISSQTKPKTDWYDVSLPDPRFKFSVVPSSNDITKYVGSDRPGLKIKGTQANSFYIIEHDTKNEAGDSTTTHSLRVPIGSESAFVRTYDKDGKLTKMVASRIAGGGDHPQVDMSYLPIEETYKLDSAYSFDSQTVKFSTSRKVDSGLKRFTNPIYSTSYSVNF